MSSTAPRTSSRCAMVEPTPVVSLLAPLPGALPSPRQAADELLAAFEAAAQWARPVGRTCAMVANAIGVPLDACDEAVHRASLTIARAIDDQHVFFDRHEYHNRQHFCEVVLTAQFLCRLHRLPVRDARRVMLAAIVHDLEHDGAAGTAFVFERRSITRAAPFLARAGVDETEYRVLAALVLATDPAQGVAVAMRSRRWHDGGGASGAIEAPVPELRGLVDSASLSHAAAVLCEADVLPSVGLSLAHALRLQDRLAREWGCTLQPADKARFIDQVVAAGVIGDYFLPNVLAIRQALCETARAA